MSNNSQVVLVACSQVRNQHCGIWSNFKPFIWENLSLYQTKKIVAFEKRHHIITKKNHTYLNAFLARSFLLSQFIL